MTGYEVIRPFYSGGDFENINYPDSCIVVDNPPFSIISKIVRFYIEKNIKFFLFAPHMTLFSADMDCTAIVCGADVVYENGANVKTSFLSNVFGDIRVIGEPALYKNLESIKNAKKVTLPLHLRHNKKIPDIMKHLLFFLFPFLAGSISLQAIDIKGRIIGVEDKNPVEFVTVVLLKSDSTYVSGSQTDISSNFSITGQFAKQDYLLKISCVGYKTSYIKINNLSADIHLGDIGLEEETKALGEVTVTGNRIINKVDKQIVFPDQMQVKTSVNAFDLLSNMNLSRLIIDPVNRTAKIGMEDVQFRINGVRADIREIVALRSQDIAHVEFYEDPGVRFGNEAVGAVVNFITVKDRESGGYLSVDTRNAPAVRFGDDNITFKANYKKSELGLNYYISYRGYNDRWTDMTGRFNFPDETITREQKGVKAPMEYQVHNINLSYNLTEPDKYVFNAVLKDDIYNSSRTNAYNILYSNSREQTFSKQDGDDYYNSPVLDIYYRRELKNKQSLTVNAVGTYIKTDNKSYYTESMDNDILTDIDNRVKGNKYSLIAEAVYNRESEKMVFSAGAKHTQGYADNKYTGNNPFVSDMKNADSYLFAQLQGSLTKKLSYTIGLGGARVWFKEGKNEATFYTMRPSLRLAYNANDNFNIKYNLSIKTPTPSLGQLSGVEQQVDSFRINRGNPGLKPYNRYTNNIILSYNKGKVGTNLYLAYIYTKKQIFQTYHIEGDKIIGLSENHKSANYFTLQGYTDVRIIKDIWNVGAWYGVFRTISNTNTAAHTYTGAFGGINSNLFYKGFNLTMSFNTRFKDMWGETISYGEDWSYIEAGYKHKEAKLSLGMSYPFKNHWSAGSKNMSGIAPSEQWTYIEENGHMLYLRFSWNMSFGRKHSAGQKTLQNADNDKGIL
jgi:hypothetical protein